MLMLVAILIGYLVGSVSFSYIIGKLWKGIDIRQHGSGNAGATNTLRVLGTVPGIIVLLLDGFKGALAVVIALYISNNDPITMIVAGIAAIIGHNWPIYLKFQGGKGVATTIGVVASLVFIPALLSALIAIVFLALTRYVSLASIIFTVLIPIFILLLDYPITYFVFTIIMAILVCVRHIENIKRLIKGTERKIGERTS
ncbi:glycerol-3-phosphate 1-O-acyltransferase PlsY [Desulfuribacillus alkaliarsenatis]|uniref:Glycerol-3-phosphate acyltransferase n=1 Tax=Desulfuribacillus alkaliarsenatis TaxID=766136 RepID=A0A1E5FZM7_9FIRM|nr:glycerol-3-phosphate 1-O-acyltransferase PlsY [Desulfuribacillus alkaliarsenatis]OEF96022.1 acyl-phosphate glycerol 3-phosphate acyltransferase [Desulfuribacillus alkaliarsenatis]